VPTVPYRFSPWQRQQSDLLSTSRLAAYCRTARLRFTLRLNPLYHDTPLAQSSSPTNTLIITPPLWQTQRTPLHVAAYHEHAPVVAALLAAGADARTRDVSRKGKGIGEYAHFWGEVISCIFGARLSGTGCDGNVEQFLL
jgi:hypothetical protein